MSGWFFGANRFSEGGPAYHGTRNDHPAAYDRTTAILTLAAVTLYLPFVLSVVTARRRRISTLLIGTVLAASAAAIAVGLTEPLWSVGTAHLVSSYCHFQEGTFVPAELTLSIGLTHYNVSYENVAISASTVIDPEVSMTKGFAPGYSFPENMDFFYNDQFEMVFGGTFLPKPRNKLRAIEQGLPNPMIIVTEYMDTFGGGFKWGLAIPAAGYYASVALYFSAVAFAVTLLLLMVIPTYGMATMVLTGALMMSSNLIYYLVFPGHVQTVVVEGAPLRFQFGLCFSMVLVCGFANVSTGIAVLIINAMRDVKAVSTFFELDFDTPWDHKVLQEDSQNRRKSQLLAQNTLGIGLNTTFLRSSVRRMRESLRYSNGRRVIRGNKNRHLSMERGEKEKPPYVDLASNIGEHDLNENSSGNSSSGKGDGVGGGRLNGGFEAGDEFVEGRRGSANANICFTL